MSDTVSVDREAWERSLDALIRQDAEIVGLKSIINKMDGEVKKLALKHPATCVCMRCELLKEAREATKDE